VPDYIVQPRPQSQRTTHWGELKRCRSLNLTDSCWEIITSIADRNAINRSELVERVMRQEAVRDVDDLNRPR
jgi:predicted DNA-binding ribbon-helix-helix protein